MVTSALVENLRNIWKDGPLGLRALEEALASGASSFGIVNSGRGPTDKELDWMEPFFRKAAEGGEIRPLRPDFN